MPRRFKRIALAVAGIALLLMLAKVLLPAALRFWFHDRPFMGKIFTPEAWAESCEGLKDTSCATEENDCPRGPMVRSLLQQHLTVGVSRDAVVGLLGPADWDRAECLHWSLGACSGLGIDYDSLFVCFDKIGHLVEAGHVQH